MESRVRVRFAPSPTGYLHVGGARTALFNWLFAKRHGGSFILRIEDTDLDRSTAEAETGLLRDLEWLGLTWDEGPGIGGPHAPYRQSERLDKYHGAAKLLLEKGSAYYCFCTEEELEKKRQEAESEHRSPHYDGTCLKLTPEEIQQRLAENRPKVVRVKVPNKDYILNDNIRGSVEFKADTLGDFIVLRSNGMPVYNFCVVVDDADMEITHVIRAEEHLPNTHRQMILYEALGKPVPVFAHVSLILGADKTKLSKRHGATSVGQYNDDGFLCDAMINYLAMLGWNEGTDQETYTRKELCEKFSLDRISKSPAVFDQAKLRWMNGNYIRALPADELERMITTRLVAAFPDEPRVKESEFVKKFIALIHLHLATLNDAVKEATTIFSGFSGELDEEARLAISAPEIAPYLAELARLFAEVPWTRDGFNGAIKAAGKATGVKGKALYMPLRVKLTGTCHGPDLVGTLELIGQKEAIRRLLI
ncbi:MAG: glutamate--tRNA ligase [Candidatus Riflebacteria bacterium]|nr:glutamate--tRNA ligase [Candidatus Riflebacteria bacterium]